MNLGRLFDSPAQLLIILLIILLLFGATRLPNTARQLGRSMRIFRSEMKEMKTENAAPAGDTAEKRDDEADDAPSRIDALEGRVVDDASAGSRATSARSETTSTRPEGDRER